MKHKTRPHHPIHQGTHTKHPKNEDIIEKGIRKGLIEKTEYGYIFKPEFFETLAIYED